MIGDVIMDTNEKATEILRNNSKEKADMFPREVEYQDYAFKASEKIKEICNERNINLPELSKETDLSLDKLKSYQRRNPAKMPVSALCNIADFLKVSLDYLFDRSDVKPVIEKEKSRQYGISPEGVVLCLFNALKFLNSEVYEDKIIIREEVLVDIYKKYYGRENLKDSDLMNAIIGECKKYALVRKKMERIEDCNKHLREQYATANVAVLEEFEEYADDVNSIINDKPYNGDSYKYFREKWDKLSEADKKEWAESYSSGDYDYELQKYNERLIREFNEFRKWKKNKEK